MAKALCESYLPIRLDALKRSDLLKKGLQSKSLIWDEHHAASVISSVYADESFIELLFRMPQKSSDAYIKRIQLSSTPCYLGGKRYWFNCPHLRNGNPCNRRASVLYLDGAEVGCRKCFNLLYQSQFESKRGHFWLLDRFIRVSDNVIAKIHTRRTRFFKGKPTKYVSRWLNKTSRINTILKQTENSLDLLLKAKTKAK